MVEPTVFVHPSVSSEEIDAGAEALRIRQTAGKKNTLPWGKLSNSTKRKWRQHAAAVLSAAAAVKPRG